jgi:hypothetical protein
MGFVHPVQADTNNFIVPTRLRGNAVPALLPLLRIKSETCFHLATLARRDSVPTQARGNQKNWTMRRFLVPTRLRGNAVPAHLPLLRIKSETCFLVPPRSKGMPA